MPVYEADWLAEASGGMWTCLPSVPVRGVSKDTRSIFPGSLYIALRGARFDGHAFTQDAFRAGAAAAMVDRCRPESSFSGGALLEVEDTSRALCALGSVYRHRVAPLTIGVTGSVGKSTVKEMTASVLEASALTARTYGNWNNEIGLPLSLLAMEPGTRFGVFEAGVNHPGEMQRLCKVLSPEWGMVVSVGPVHIEFFGSVESIAAEKRELLRSLPADGRAFLCADDEWFCFLKDDIPCELRTVSLCGKGDLNLNLQETPQRLSVHEKSSGEQHGFDWPWAGRHQALNAGFALLAGREAGLTWLQLEAGLAAYRPLPMRWEEIHLGDWFIINDAYNANPVSMQVAVETFAKWPCKGGRWLVLGDMLELGAAAGDAHRSLGRSIVRQGRWAGLVAVGPLAAGIAEGALEAGFDSDHVWTCPDACMAASILESQLCAGDAVLLKGSRGMALELIVQELKSNISRGLE